MKKVFTLLIAVALLLFTGLPSANATIINVPGDQSTIQAAINAAVDGDVIQLSAQTFVEASLITVNKDVTIQGMGTGSTLIQVSGTGNRFDIVSPGVTIKDLSIQKTDKTGVQNIIGVLANNFTLQNTVMSGQFVIGEGDISRALVVSGGLSGLLIDGNTFYALRQPMYLTGPTTGVASNNNTYGTKGWVMEGGDLTFTGNTWGVNVYDIAILAGAPPTAYLDIVAISNANNGAVIEDQRVSPAVLSVVRVDAGTSFSSDLGGAYHPYSTIAPAITRVVAGGKIYVAAGTYTENMNITKSVEFRGANYGISAGYTSGVRGPESVIVGEALVSATGVKFDGLEFDSPVAATTKLVQPTVAGLTILFQNNVFDMKNQKSAAIYNDGMASTTFTILNNKFKNQIYASTYSARTIYAKNTFCTITGNDFSNVEAGVYLIGTSTDATIVSGNRFNVTNLAVLIGERKGIQIINNDFVSGNAISCDKTSNLTISNNNFGVGVFSAGWFTSIGSGIEMHNNSILSAYPAAYGPTYAGKTLFNFSSTQTVNATCNWWGTNNASTVASKISGNVNTTPFSIAEGGACTGGIPIITTIQPPTSAACGTLDVPVTVKDFNNVGAISAVLNFDPVKLQLLPITGLTSPGVTLHPDLVALGSAAVSGSNAVVIGSNTIGQFRLGDLPVPAITLGEDAVLFTLHFNILPAALGGTFTDLNWSTVYQDCEYAGPSGTPTYTGTFNNKTITIPAWPVRNITQNLGYCNIQPAVIAANSNDEIEVSAGTFTEIGQIVIDKNLTITGAGKGLTIVKPAQNTGNTGDARAWFLVNAGITFNLSNLTLDGSGKLVFQGIRQKGVGTIDNVEFKNIKYNESGPDYSGVAVAAFGNGNVNITNSSFAAIGRVGVLYFGAGITGSNFHDNTYTGKGTGDWLDYMLDISAGAVVDVEDCTVSGNRGVASVDNSTSAGIIVSTYYGEGTKATITGCTITDNTTGINVGYDASDLSIVVAEDNKIYGNDYGVTSTNPVVDASLNWWGDATGPYNTPYNVCGLGNDVEGNVTFRPWWTNLAMTISSTTSGPAEFGGPVAITSSVECVASATAPTTLPVVKDFCGTVLSHSVTSPLRTENITNCEGTVTYAYTYTDVLGASLVWTYTYIIDRTTAPVVPANSSKTVACLNEAVQPTLLSTVVDQQQTQVKGGDPNWKDCTSIGQSFTCGTSGWLTKLDLNVASLAQTISFTLKIYVGNGISGTEIYSGNHSLNSTGWKSLTIAQEVAPYLTAGTQYTFWLTSWSYQQVGLLCMNPNVYNGGVAMDGCTEGCSPTYAWDQYPAYDLVFKTYMTAVPIVKDVCGNVIATPTPVESGTYVGCEGTKVYTYTYTDCAGLSSEWKFTYTIERNDFTMPANTTATVVCVSNVVVPTPPVVNDNCGNPITPVAGPTPTPPACEGTMVYTWTYTDCETNIHTWTHTVTIDDNVAPTITVCAPPVTIHMNDGCTATGVILGTPTATDNCGGAVTFTNNAPAAFPLGETPVIWTAKDCALNTSATCTQIVTVVKNTISGTLVYNNTAKTPMNLVKMVIKDATNTQVGDEVTTTSAGAFTFPDLCAGTYTIHVTYNAKDAGGINATDAAQVNKWSTNFGAIEHVKFLAGDVTFNKWLDSGDALKIQGYFVFPGNPVYAITPKWSYWKKGELITNNTTPYNGIGAWPPHITVTITGDLSGLELYGMLTGDFDGSLVPEALKSANPSLTLAENSNLQIGANQAFELPLRAASAMQVGAVSMILDIPSELVTVQNVKIKGSNEPVMWAINGNELRIGWHSINPVNVAENGALLTLELMTTSAFAQSRTLDIALPFNQLNELADGNFEAMENAELMVAKVGNQTVGNIAIDNNGGLLFSNYPNPFSKVTTLEYNLPADGKVTINLFNNLGQLVSVLVDADQSAGQHMFRYESNTLQPGIYVAKLRLVNSETDMVGTIKLSVQK